MDQLPDISMLVHLHCPANQKRLSCWIFYWPTRKWIRSVRFSPQEIYKFSSICQGEVKQPFNLAAGLKIWILALLKALKVLFLAASFVEVWQRQKTETTLYQSHTVVPKDNIRFCKAEKEFIWSPRGYPEAWKAKLMVAILHYSPSDFEQKIWSCLQIGLVGCPQFCCAKSARELLLPHIAGNGNVERHCHFDPQTHSSTLVCVLPLDDLESHFLISSMLLDFFTHHIFNFLHRTACSSNVTFRVAQICISQSFFGAHWFFSRLQLKDSFPPGSLLFPGIFFHKTWRLRKQNWNPARQSHDSETSDICGIPLLQIFANFWSFCDSLFGPCLPVLSWCENSQTCSLAGHRAESSLCILRVRGRVILDVPPSLPQQKMQGLQNCPCRACSDFGYEPHPLDSTVQQPCPGSIHLKMLTHQPCTDGPKTQLRAAPLLQVKFWKMCRRVPRPRFLDTIVYQVPTNKKRGSKQWNKQITTISSFISHRRAWPLALRAWAYSCDQKSQKRARSWRMGTHKELLLRHAITCNHTMSHESTEKHSLSRLKALSSKKIHNIEAAASRLPSVQRTQSTSTLVRILSLSHTHVDPAVPYRKSHRWYFFAVTFWSFHWFSIQVAVNALHIFCDTRGRFCPRWWLTTPTCLTDVLFGLLNELQCWYCLVKKQTTQCRGWSATTRGEGQWPTLTPKVERIDQTHLHRGCGQPQDCVACSFWILGLIKQYLLLKKNCTGLRGKYFAL